MDPTQSTLGKLSFCTRDGVAESSDESDAQASASLGFAIIWWVQMLVRSKVVPKGIFLIGEVGLEKNRQLKETLLIHVSVG